MDNSFTFNKILHFIDTLSNVSIELPNGFKIINPYKGDDKEQILKAAHRFYKKYYNDKMSRRIILGSSPARRGSALTGIPFEDASSLENVTRLSTENFHINQSSSNFLYEVMKTLGGKTSFYEKFYMNFVCPLGITKTNAAGNEVNCNYYENREIKEILQPFIIKTLKEQIAIGIDRSECYCIGSGENYQYLSSLNEEYSFFDKIIPLEHPRFITQYKAKDKDIYMRKYIQALK